MKYEQFCCNEPLVLNSFPASLTTTRAAVNKVPGDEDERRGRRLEVGGGWLRSHAVTQSLGQVGG